MELNVLIGEFFYIIIGIIFIICGVFALRDKELKTRIGTAVFWFLLAFTFIVGPHIPRWITGLCILVIAALTAMNQVRQPGNIDVPSKEFARKSADKIGNKIFIPAVTGSYCCGCGLRTCRAQTQH